MMQGIPFLSSRFPDLFGNTIRYRAWMAGILCLGLVGCGGVEPGITAVIGATSTIINTDKLPTDFVAEAVTGLDCSTVRQSVDKGPLCRPLEQRVIERPIYCYRTLAAINCYADPDPFGDGAQPVQ